MKTTQTGFSLIELMVCIGIITTSIIFIVDMFTSMLNASTKGSDWSVATALASARLERMQYNPSEIVYDIKNSSGGLLAGGAVTFDPAISEASAVSSPGLVSLNKNTYYITYHLYQVPQPASAQTPGSDEYYVEVQVNWFEPPPTTAQPGAGVQGFGQLSTRLGRLIYVH